MEGVCWRLRRKDLLLVVSKVGFVRNLEVGCIKLVW